MYEMTVSVVDSDNQLNPQIANFLGAALNLAQQGGRVRRQGSLRTLTKLVAARENDAQLGTKLVLSLG